MMPFIKVLLLCLLSLNASAVVITHNTSGGTSTAIADGEMDVANGTNNDDALSMKSESAGAAAYNKKAVIELTTAILSIIPSGSTIDTVEIQLYWESGYIDGGSATLTIYRILADTDITQFTWANRLTSTAWNTAGAAGSGTDRAASASASLSVSSSAGYKTWATSAGLVADVQALRDGTISELFWYVQAGSGNENYSTFTSSEGTDGQRPIITITYTAGGGSSNAPRAMHYKRMAHYAANDDEFLLRANQ